MTKIRGFYIGKMTVKKIDRWAKWLYDRLGPNGQKNERLAT